MASWATAAETRIAELTAENAKLREALQAVKPLLPLGFAATAHAGAADDKNAALDHARKMMDAALSAVSNGEG